MKWNDAFGRNRPRHTPEATWSLLELSIPYYDGRCEALTYTNPKHREADTRCFNAAKHVREGRGVCHIHVHRWVHAWCPLASAFRFPSPDKVKLPKWDF